MGRGALGVLVLLCLFGAASLRNDMTRCWVKGKEVAVSPLECPAEFDGVDAKLCCRICYGANCCLPRKARVNQNKCPHHARLARFTLDQVLAKGTDVPKKEGNLGNVALVLVGSILLMILALFICWLLRHNRGVSVYAREEESDCNPDNLGLGVFNREMQCVRNRVNVQSCRVHATGRPRRPSPPPSYTPRESSPPPYSLVDPLGIQNLPPSGPGNPVVEFRRSGSGVQDDGVVILPLPEGAACRGAPETPE